MNDSQKASARQTDSQPPSLPAGDVLAALHAAYQTAGQSLSLQQLKERVLQGVALWVDLELDKAADILGHGSAKNLPQEGGVPDVLKTETLQQVIDQLVALTMEDALTGLFNRRYFDHRLTQEILRSRREQQPCSMILADVDDFKKINDTFGHDVGDQALQVVSRLLRECLRVTDEVTARFGGEEFAIILPSTSLRNAYRVAERLRARIVRDLAAQVPQLHDHEVSASFGVATANPKESMTTRQLIERADAALYEAKRTGKNSVRVHGQMPPAHSATGVSRDEREGLLP